MRKALKTRTRQRGFSLVELLVVMVISMILIAGIYRMFTGQLKIFTSEDETATLQQQARMAEELLLYTIQQTGGGAPEGGNSVDMHGLPVIAASDRYLVVQYDDPNYTDSKWVVRANEVVIFAVSNETGTKTEDIEFTAYFDKNEDGKIDRASEGTDVAIPLVLRGPPYNLYRMTLTNDGGVTKSLVAQNVDNLVFRYFDNDGAQIPYNPATKMPLPMPYELADKPVAPAKGLPDIRFIEMELVMRTKNADPSYSGEFTADASNNYAFSVATYSDQGEETESKTFNDGHRRRSYVTKMVPRNLPAMPCGRVTLQATSATCPNGATVSVVNAQNRYAEPLGGKTVKFSFPGGSHPTFGPFFGGGGTTASPTLSATGTASVTVNYTGPATTVVVAAEVANVDCSPGGPTNFTLTDSVGVRFTNGNPAWVVITQPKNTRDGLLTDKTPLLTSGDTATTVITTHDECGNTVAPQPGYSVGTYDGAGTAASNMLGSFTVGNPVETTASPQTLTINSPTAATATMGQNADGFIEMHLMESAPRPPWVKKVYIDGLPTPWGTSLGAPIAGPDILTFYSAPWPPAGLGYTASNIDGQEVEECPATPDLQWTDNFTLLDSHGFKIYSTSSPINSASPPDGARLADSLLTAEISSTNSVPANALASENYNGKNAAKVFPKLTYSGAETGTGGLYSLTWGPAECKLPDTFTPLLPPPSLNPARPFIDVKLDSSLQKTLNMTVGACSTCDVNVEQPNTCEGVATVRIGICNPVNAPGGVKLTLKPTLNSYAPFWINADRSVANPGSPMEMTRTLVVGDNVFYVAIGNTPIGGVIGVEVQGLEADGSDGVWSCDDASAITVANRCEELRVISATLDDAGNEISRDPLASTGGTFSPICAATSSRIYLELDHCRNSLDLDPPTVTVQLLNGEAIYDEEEIPLPAVEPTPPGRKFVSAAINFVNASANKGNKVIEYPEDGSLTLVIKQWVNTHDSTDTCPDGDIRFPFIQPIGLCFPNAITSGSGASWSGNFKIHWGDIVVRGSMASPLGKLIVKDKNASYNGSPAPSSGYSDRLADIYVGHTEDGTLLNDGSIDGTILAGAAGTVNQPFKNSEDAGNYFTNISYDKITSMIIALKYDKLKELAKGRNSYWFAISNDSIYNPTTDTEAKIDAVLNNPPNAYYNGDLIFIDIKGTEGSGGKWIEPQMTLSGVTKPVDESYVQNLADAGLDNLPSFSLEGNYYTAGIIFVAGNLTLGGGGAGKTIPDAQAPPNEDTRYDYITSADPAITDENELPISAKPTAPSSQFDLLGMQLKGALYCIGQFDAQGSPRIYGSVSAERGYGNSGTPEVWYDYRLNQSGHLGSSLCIKCCKIKLNPSTVRITKGDSAPITATGNEGTIIWDVADPSIATISVTGTTATVTAKEVGTTKLWAVDSNNCAVQSTITVVNDCTGYVMTPAAIPDLKIGETQNLQLDKDGAVFSGGNFTWITDSDAVILTPPASATGVQLASVTGNDCGFATITATDNSTPKVCVNSPFNAPVSVVSPLSITSIENTPPSKTAYVNISGAVAATTSVTVTTPSGAPVGGLTISYPYLGDASRARLDFTVDGVFVVKVSDNTTPHCPVQMASLSIGCPVLTPTVAINSPVNGAVYFKSAAIPYGSGLSSGTKALEFMATPDGGGTPGIEYVDLKYTNNTSGLTTTLRDTTSEYCGFGGDDCSLAENLSDIATWATGSYTFNAETRTNPDSCDVRYPVSGVASATPVTITLKNCDTSYTDNFGVGTEPNSTYWLSSPTSIGSGTAAGVKASDGRAWVSLAGGQMVLIVENKNNNDGLASRWEELKATATTALNLNQGFTASIDLTGFSVSAARISERAGLRLTDGSGNYINILGTAGTISSAPIIEYKNGASTGTITAGSSSSGTVNYKIEYLPATKEVRVFINNANIGSVSTSSWTGTPVIGPYIVEPGTSGTVRTLVANFDNFVLNCLNPIPAP